MQIKNLTIEFKFEKKQMFEREENETKFTNQKRKRNPKIKRREARGVNISFQLLFIAKVRKLLCKLKMQFKSNHNWYHQCLDIRSQGVISLFSFSFVLTKTLSNRKREIREFNPHVIRGVM